MKQLSSLQINLFLALGLCLILLVFGGSIQNNFLNWDDTRYVSENYIMTVKGLKGFWLSLRSVVMINFHPITVLSLWANVQLFGLEAKPIIVTNILIHVLNTYLIFKFCLKLKLEQKLALITSFIWAIHPMHVEAVIWVSARKELLYTFFFLLSSIFYINSKVIDQKKNFLLSFLFFTLSSLSKASAIVLPVCFLLYDWYLDEKSSLNPKKIGRLLPFYLFSALIFFINQNTLQNKDFFGLLTKNEKALDVINAAKPFTFEQLHFAFYGFWTYLFKLFVPIQLHHWYLYPKLGGIIYLSIPMFVLLLFLVFKLQNKKLIFGLSFFLINVILVLQVIPFSPAILAERYSYLSYFGLIFSTVFLFSKLKYSYILLLIIPIFMVLSHRYTNVWKNDYTLWKNTYQYYPADYKVARSYLTQVQKRNNDEESSAVINNSIRNGLVHPEFFYLKSQIEIKEKNPQSALKNLDLALQSVESDQSFKKNSLAVVYLSKVVAFEMLNKPDSAMINMQIAQKIMMQTPKN